MPQQTPFPASQDGIKKDRLMGQRYHSAALAPRRRGDPHTPSRASGIPLRPAAGDSPGTRGGDDGTSLGA
ncbi:hypothetical protein GCM10028789_22960 [Sinomonas halotolerans]